MLQISMGPGESAMGWLEWTSSVIGSTAWPIALVLVALIFRGQINKLLKRIRGAKYGDAEVLFREELDKIEAQAAELPAPEPAASDPGLDAPQEPAPADDLQHTGVQVPHPDIEPELLQLVNQQQKFNEIAKLSPSAAVLNAWRDVELALEDLFKRSGLKRSSSRNNAFGTALMLYKMGVIDQYTMDIFNDLRSLRNNVAHVEEVSITDAFRFEGLSRQVIRRLKDAYGR